MTIRRRTLIATSTLLVGAGAWFVYSLMAAQGQGVLAQAPLNTQVQVTPAFIMGVDNSGSMSTDELLFKTSQGNGYWDSTRRSFFDASGVAYESGGGRTGYGKAFDSGVPRPDFYGAARSPLYNRAYFNPAILYTPWLRSDGTPEPDATPANFRNDPRNTGTRSITLPEYYSFNFSTGMRLSAGTRYYRDRLCNGKASLLAPNEWVTLASDFEYGAFAGTCPTDVEYYRAVVYLPDDATPPPGYDLTKRILVTGAGPAGIDLWRYDYVESNFTTGGADAVRNFANWWMYYGNRNRAMIAAMTTSMSDVNNVRVGYFQINPPNPGTNVLMHDMGVQSEKDALFVKMRALNASGTTPTRRATRYMGEQFMRTDSGAPIKLACQKNAGMLFTDGFTNDNALSGGQTVGNADGAMGPPFADNQSNTIADVAAWMYNTNMRPDLPIGQVPVQASCSGSNPDPRLDCQRNLHVNFYGVTLGARGRVYDVNQAATDDPFANPPAWAATGGMNLDPANVDDIWHASLNSRGEFINAQSPVDITAAIRRVLTGVTAGASPSGSIALTGARIGTGSLTAIPQYEVANEGTDWFSRLVASQVVINPVTRVAEYQLAWEASGRLPGWATRRNHTFYAAGNVARQFNNGNVSLNDLCTKPVSRYPGISRCTAGEITGLGGGADSQLAIRYLLGDVDLERKNGGPFRDRTNRLGDIVNSTPVIASPVDDYGYRALPTANGGGTGPGSYGAYLTTKAASHRYMVYAGANDGMLHAFDGGMGAAGTLDSNGGIEQFAYIPATSLGHMGNLLFPFVATNLNDQKFIHRYYVDGPIAVSDARYGGNWRTVLVGTSGAGGRSVFGLNVTTPGSFGIADRLWEVNDLDSTLGATVNNNIGHVLGKPVIVPVKHNNGTVAWYAIFGNGYNSASGKAVLFMVEMKAGAPNIRMVEAAESSPAAGTNGIGNLVVVDRWGGSGMTSPASDGFADTVYAADQKGAIWKFDLRTASTNSALATPVRPLFVSDEVVENGNRYRQPITGGLTATAGASGGVMLFFGTGSFSFLGDPQDTTVQSLYGINDLERGPPSTTITSGDLMPRTVQVAGTVRTLVDGVTPPAMRGWRLTLPAGERFVGYPRVASGIVFLPTYAPQASTAACSTAGFNWLFGLDTNSGAGALSYVRQGAPDGAQLGAGTAAIPLDTGGSAPVKDVAVMAVPRLGPPGTATGPTPPNPPAQGCWMAVTVAGAATMYIPYPCGRQSWRQIQ